MCAVCSQPFTQLSEQQMTQEMSWYSIHEKKNTLAKLSRDLVVAVHLLMLDNRPSFKFHLIWIFQNHTPLCTICPACPAVGLDEWTLNIVELPTENLVDKSFHTIDKSGIMPDGFVENRLQTWHVFIWKPLLLHNDHQHKTKANHGWLLKPFATWR